MASAVQIYCLLPFPKLLDAEIYIIHRTSSTLSRHIP